MIGSAIKEALPRSVSHTVKSTVAPRPSDEYAPKVSGRERRGGRAATFAILGGLLAASCESTSDDVTSDVFAASSPRETNTAAEAARPVRVYRNPYETVDWSNDVRLTAQHHDHIALRSDYILAYDVAGYDVVSLMDYSGNDGLSYALRQRPWPATDWISQDVFINLRNVKLFLPNAEEVGIEHASPRQRLQHVTSPFLTTYIEGATNGPEQPLLPNQYRTIEQLFALVRSQRGFPCLAHPWNYRYDALELGNSYCVEIYNAFGEAQKEEGWPWYTETDRNEATVKAWDRVLIRNQGVFGIAVNDHFGPYASAESVSSRVRDSGKIVVLAKAVDLAAYRNAFETGSFFAVRDHGETKNRYPTVYSIAVGHDSIYVETTNSVKWIANGQLVSDQALLEYASLFNGIRYVRAEISDSGGSTVYTQAFSIRPVGDVDGDYDVDTVDESICLEAVDLAPDIDVMRACAAVSVSP